MIYVHLNGLKMVPGIDYSTTRSSVSFSQPPAVGDSAIVTMSINGGGAHMQRFTGDGHTYLFQLDQTFENRYKLQTILDDAWTYHNVPAVQDLLEQLGVVIALVKQDIPLKTK